ncbi:MAG: hypothetical protein M9928_22635 [Anaerolineae bacterium]|nr:hypothetical protein [Anaerolineae bacterium]MCO5198268.1 hypothetical protein [Anaerolineae bacterium]MCO5207811.1 hypothetical protein [Anaerolineae bacterium]
MSIGTIMFGLLIIALLLFLGAIIYIMVVKGTQDDDNKTQGVDDKSTQDDAQ